jgi:hypothetical protein
MSLCCSFSSTSGISISEWKRMATNSSTSIPAAGLISIERYGKRKQSETGPGECEVCEHGSDRRILNYGKRYSRLCDKCEFLKTALSRCLESKRIVRVSPQTPALYRWDHWTVIWGCSGRIREHSLQVRMFTRPGKLYVICWV